MYNKILWFYSIPGKRNIYFISLFAKKKHHFYTRCFIKVLYIYEKLLLVFLKLTFFPPLPSLIIHFLLLCYAKIMSLHYNISPSKAFMCI